MSSDYTVLDESERKVVNYETSTTAILRNMLQEAYNFSGQKPEIVHVYFQIGDGTASAEFLFEVEGTVYGIDELLQSDVDLGYDSNDEHRQRLMNFIGQQLLDFISLCVTYNRPFPSEVKTSAEIDTSEIFTQMGYNFDRAIPDSGDAVVAWKKELQDPSTMILRKLSDVNPPAIDPDAV